MADFGAFYAEMQQVTSSLSQARDDIQGQLDTLKGQVDTLLGEHFKTQHASGKFGGSERVGAQASRRGSHGSGHQHPDVGS